jgi:hypothetical protein
MRFRLAPMCRLIYWMTVGLLAIPIAFAVGAAFGAGALLGPAVIVALIYAWIWTRFRPTAFVVHRDALVVVWPLKRRTLDRAEIADVRVITQAELREEVGRGGRVGAGGLWGGFGWLWSTRRGIVQMYISRTDEFVWIERSGGRPWLITPERPDAFVRALSPTIG